MTHEKLMKIYERNKIMRELRRKSHYRSEINKRKCDGKKKRIILEKLRDCRFMICVIELLFVIFIFNFG